ncbi:hypothetical protein [Paenibacillus sp. PvR148]
MEATGHYHRGVVAYAGLDSGVYSNEGLFVMPKSTIAAFYSLTKLQVLDKHQLVFTLDANYSFTRIFL